MATTNAMTSRAAGMRSTSHLARRLRLRRGDALIVVDVQRDFLPGGLLAVPDGDAVIEPLNAYIRTFDTRELPIFFTRDWHPINHCSFTNAGGRWPAHCVQLLHDLNVHRVLVGGLATDYCVCATVCDARANGLDVLVLSDAIRAVNATPDDEARALRRMEACGARFFTPNGWSAGARQENPQRIRDTSGDGAP